MISNMNSNRIAWLDLETGGLDGMQKNGTVGCIQYPILEIALIVTDSELNLSDEAGIRVVIHHSETVLAKMDSWALEHHQKSGLLDEVRASTIDIAQAEQLVIEYLRQNGATAYNRKTKSGTLMAGNSIKFDRNYLNCQMPELDTFFHYRQIDISSVALLCRLWKPEIEREVKKDYRHLALQDIKESIEEAKLYKRLLFK